MDAFLIHLRQNKLNLFQYHKLQKQILHPTWYIIISTHCQVDVLFGLQYFHNIIFEINVQQFRNHYEILVESRNLWIQPIVFANCKGNCTAKRVIDLDQAMGGV